MTGAGFTQEGEDEIFKGYIISVVNGRFRAPDGSAFERDIVRHPGAVAVVPVLDDGSLVLVRQYRAPVDAEVLELPAGIRDVAGEAPVETARRELTEETGYRAAHMEPLVRFQNSVGHSDEEIEIFLATGLTEVGREAQGVEETHMTVERVGLDDALARIDTGELRDAKSVVGVLMAQRRLGR